MLFTSLGWSGRIEKNFALGLECSNLGRPAALVRTFKTLGKVFSRYRLSGR